MILILNVIGYAILGVVVAIINYAVAKAYAYIKYGYTFWYRITWDLTAFKNLCGFICDMVFWPKTLGNIKSDMFNVIEHDAKELKENRGD